MRVGKRLIVTLASSLALAAAGAMLVAATAAGANPRNSSHKQDVEAGPVHISSKCRNGIYSGYCGTEQNFGDGLGFYYNGSSDWLSLQYQGGSDVFFEYAPKGMPSNQCITESGSRLYLSTCTGASSQLFAPTEETNGFTWQNVATGLYVQDNGSSKPLKGKPADGQANQEWNYTTTNP